MIQITSTDVVDQIKEIKQLALMLIEKYETKIAHGAYVESSIHNEKWTDIYSDEKNWARLRAAVLERDRYRCVLCHSTEKIVVHHWKTRKDGGPDELRNCSVLCAQCHAYHHSTVL